MFASTLRWSLSRAPTLWALGMVAMINSGVATGDERPQDAVPCKAKLTVDNPAIEAGEEIQFAIVVSNQTEEPITLLNPLHSGLVRVETTRLLVFDGTGKCVGDLLESRKLAGSAISPTAAINWLTIPPDAMIGKKDHVRARVRLNALQAGTYRLQMVFLDTFVSDHPYAGLPPPYTAPDRENDPRYADRWKKWQQDHPGKELFRSNAVEIKIVDRGK